MGTPLKNTSWKDAWETDRGKIIGKQNMAVDHLGIHPGCTDTTSVCRRFVQLISGVASVHGRRAIEDIQHPAHRLDTTLGHSLSRTTFSIPNTNS